MGVDSTDAYGKPVFNDAITMPGDLSALADYIDTFANVRRGTSAERQGLAPGKRRAGMQFVETDTGNVYVDRGDGSWMLAAGDTGWTALTLTSGWVNYGSPFRPAAVRVHDGEIQYQGVIKGGSSGAANPITTVAAQFRPTGGDGMFSAIANAGSADVRVQQDGTLIIAAFQNGGNNGIVSLHQIRMTR